MIEDSKQKIPCGGFYIGEGLELDNTTRTLKTVTEYGGTFNVNFVFDGDNFVADKTYNEIVAAIDAGNIGLGHLTLYDLPLDLIAFRYDDNGIINFTCDYLGLEQQAAICYFLLLKPDESTVAGRFTYTTSNWMYL